MNKKVKKIKEKMEKEGMEVVLGRWQFEMMGMEFILNLREVEERYFEEKKVFVGNCSIATPIGNDYKGTFRLEETSKKENCRFFDFNLHALSTFFAFLLEVPLKSEEPSLASSSLFLQILRFKVFLTHFLHLAPYRLFRKHGTRRRRNRREMEK